MNGVFAVDKPAGMTLSDVVAKLSKLFDKLDVFANDLAEARRIKHEQLTAGTNWKPTKIKNRVDRLGIKVGHGGTLDPMAQGVLIIGVGSGTKQLSHFLGNCKKTYEAKAMLGQSTTTGDSEGEVLSRTETEHVTVENLQNAARKFTGKGKQTPPLFSALKVDGMPLYEYARKGLPLPRAIKAREAFIHEFEVHGPLAVDPQYKPMKLETDSDGKTLASMLALNLTLKDSELIFSDDFMADESVPDLEKVTLIRPRMLPEDAPPRDELPVVGLTTTVGLGTYIRSLISDLGRAVELSAHMVYLNRTKQAEYEVGKNTFQVLDFLERDERLWGPVLKRALDQGLDIVVADEFVKVEEKLRPLLEKEAEAKAEAKEETIENEEKKETAENGDTVSTEDEGHASKKQKV